jgi:hypothetical protein
VRRKAAHITKDGSKIQGKAGALPNDIEMGGPMYPQNTDRKSGKKKAWLGSHARTTTRRMEEPLPGARRAVRKSFNFLSSRLANIGPIARNL